MSTPHNEANKGDIVKTVIMPGDPLRAKYIVETMNNQGVDWNKAYKQIITAGFDSRNEALRLQQYYEDKVRTTTRHT